MRMSMTSALLNATIAFDEARGRRSRNCPRWPFLAMGVAAATGPSQYQMPSVSLSACWLACLRSATAGAGGSSAIEIPMSRADSMDRRFEQRLRSGEPLANLSLRQATQTVWVCKSK